MSWNEIESYEAWQWTYFILRIISATSLWVFSTLLLKLIVEYQKEKPKNEKSDFDIFYIDSAWVAMVTNFWFCMVYVSSIYIPIPLSRHLS